MFRRRAGLDSAIVPLIAIVGAASWITPSFAHRLDELFQEARVSIQSDRVVVDLDLTPGIQAAPGLIAVLDTDRNGVISGEEGLDFAQTVIRQSALSVDGTVLPLAVTGHDESAVAVLRAGAGVIHVQAQSSPHPMAAGGAHVVRYRNGFDPGLSLYAANATLPADEHIVIRRQERDQDQRELAIHFDVRGRFAAAAIGGPALLMGIVTALLLIRRWHRYRVATAVGSAMTVLFGVLLMDAAPPRRQTGSGYWNRPRGDVVTTELCTADSAAATTPARGGAIG